MIKLFISNNNRFIKINRWCIEVYDNVETNTRI